MEQKIYIHLGLELEEPQRSFRQLFFSFCMKIKFDCFVVGAAAAVAAATNGAHITCKSLLYLLLLIIFYPLLSDVITIYFYVRRTNIYTYIDSGKSGYHIINQMIIH